MTLGDCQLGCCLSPRWSCGVTKTDPRFADFGCFSEGTVAGAEVEGPVAERPDAGWAGFGGFGLINQPRLASKAGSNMVANAKTKTGQRAA
jgi:hypothetical protein